MRLIDAEKIQVPIKMVHNISGCYMIRIEDVQRIISEQPTAFDKEKVVERLEELREDNVGRNLNVCDAYDTAIEIVEKGGVA